MTEAVLAGAGEWIAADADAQTCGLFRLSRGATKWEALSSGLPEPVEVRAVAVHPDDPAILYAGTQFGPYRSRDGGDSWSALDFPAAEVVWSILIHPVDSHIIYVGTERTSIYRSDDDGRRWQRLPVGKPEGLCDIGIPTRTTRLAVDPSNADEVYASLEVGGVVRSLDGGATWSDCNAGLLSFAKHEAYRSRELSDSDVEGMMDSHALAVSAARPGTLFLATRLGLFVSTDKGETWADMRIGRFSELTYARDVVVSSHDPRVLHGAFSVAAVSDAGALYQSVDLGDTWTRLDNGIEIMSTLMKVATSARDPNWIFGAARRGQVFGTEDGGETWREYPLPGNVQGLYALACT